MNDWTTPRTWNIGELITKAMLDTQIRDNELALWVYTAGGQIPLSTNGVRLGVLDAAASNVTNKVIMSNGTTWTPIFNTKYFTIILNSDVALNAGDDAARIRIPAHMDGWKITEVGCSRKSGTGVMNIQIRNVRTGNNVLSTALTIDSGETDSATAAIPAVIDTANDDLVATDQIAIDVDGAGTSTFLAIVTIGIERF
jgi:hypothetical protein